MVVVYSKNKVPIRLTQERWEHITRRHPEMENQKEKVENTISDPDIIQNGDFGELLAIRLYSTASLMRRYLVVVYKESTDQDGFVVTAYFTRSPSKRRRIIWKR